MLLYRANEFMTYMEASQIDHLLSRLNLEYKTTYFFVLLTPYIRKKIRVMANKITDMSKIRKVGVRVHYILELYIALHLDAFQSSQFRYHYKVWIKQVNPVMHMNYKMYVD